MITPHRCPICNKPASSADSESGTSFPFCSDRCRKVDFHRWFDGRYAIVEEVDPDVAEFLRDDPDITVKDESDEHDPGS